MRRSPPIDRRYSKTALDLNSPLSNCTTNVFESCCAIKTYGVNSMHLGLSAEDEECVFHNAMLTKVEAVDLLHSTLGQVAVQRTKKSINTEHVDRCHESHPAWFKSYIISALYA